MALITAVGPVVPARTGVALISAIRPVVPAGTGVALITAIGPAVPAGTGVSVVSWRESPQQSLELLPLLTINHIIGITLERVVPRHVLERHFPRSRGVIDPGQIDDLASNPLVISFVLAVSTPTISSNVPATDERRFRRSFSSFLTIVVRLADTRRFLAADGADGHR
jgi:hypothetical protein